MVENFKIFQKSRPHTLNQHYMLEISRRASLSDTHLEFIMCISFHSLITTAVSVLMFFLRHVFLCFMFFVCPKFFCCVFKVFFMFSCFFKQYLGLSSFFLLTFYNQSSQQSTKKLELDESVKNKEFTSAQFREVMDCLTANTDQQRTIPKVFVCGRYVGGGTETKNMFKSGELQKRLDECEKTY